MLSENVNDYNAMNMAAGSIVVVAHNSGECIEPCLRSLVGRTDWKIILVDNASSDDTLVRAGSPGLPITIVANSQNLGFAGAVNQGIAIATGNVLLILNPDVVVGPASLANLTRALEAPGVGAVTGALLQANGQIAKGFAIRSFPTLGSMLAELLLVNRVWPRNPLNRRYRCLDLDYTHGQDIEQPAGACLAIKREAWEQVNGFDESFFPVWFEDVDFCRRLRDRGWRIRYCPEATFVHSGGHSVNKLDFRDRQSYWYRNLLRYFAKHHNREMKCLRIGVVAGMALRSLLVLLGARPGGVVAREALTAYWQVLWNYGVLGRALQTGPNKRALAPSVVS